VSHRYRDSSRHRRRGVIETDGQRPKIRPAERPMITQALAPVTSTGMLAQWPYQQLEFVRFCTPDLQHVQSEELWASTPSGADKIQYTHARHYLGSGPAQTDKPDCYRYTQLPGGRQERRSQGCRQTRRRRRRRRRCSEGSAAAPSSHKLPPALEQRGHSRSLPQTRARQKLEQSSASRARTACCRAAGAAADGRTDAERRSRRTDTDNKRGT
jgi:hypothetical protein